MSQRVRDISVDFQPFGDMAVRIQFGDTIDPRINRAIRHFASALQTQTPYGVTEWVFGYTTLMVYYQPWLIRYESLCEQLRALEKDVDFASDPVSDIVEIPTVYGRKWGPDLVTVANHHSLTEQQVIDAHCSGDYLVYFIGFTPGFPYLGGLPENLATPRLTTPRAIVPAGSVGIGGAQTGIYPTQTPGGWQIIGRTPLVLYNHMRQPPALLKAGDTLRFVSISEEEYHTRMAHD